MRATIFTNITIFDGLGSDPFPGEVMVEGNCIAKVTSGKKQIEHEDGAELVNGEGA